MKECEHTASLQEAQRLGQNVVLHLWSDSEQLSLTDIRFHQRDGREVPLRPEGVWSGLHARSSVLF